MRNCVVFQANLHTWNKFYATTGRDCRDKYQLCILSSLISAIIIIISLSLSELGVSSRCHFLSQVLYFVGFLAWSLKNTQRKNILHIFVHQHQIYVLYLSPPSVSQLDKWANQPLHLKSCPWLPGSTLFGPEIRTWEHLTHDDTCGGDYDDCCLKQKMY